MTSLSPRHSPRATLIAAALGMLGALACALGVALPQPDDTRPAPASVRPVEAPAAAPRFERWDVFVDSGAQPLAAYQVEVKAAGASAGRVTIAGIEGGEGGDTAGAFNSAPYYDPLAMQGDVVVIGALAQGAATTGRVRVASVHVMVDGGTPPTELSARAMTAGAPDGHKIDADVCVTKR